MAMIAFRMDPQLEEKLRRVSSEEKKTKTEVIREALDQYFCAKSAPGRRKQSGSRITIAEALKADIGIWDGPADASVDTGKQLREILDEKHRTRRV